MDNNCNDYSQSCQQPVRNTSMENSMPIGMCYVPWQMWGPVYDPYKALSRGTMFPDLDKPFLGGGC